MESSEKGEHPISRMVARYGERPTIAAIVIAGVALRVSWNALRPTFGATGEARNVAEALARGRGFADAYGAGTGPTAHFYPLTPGIGGAVYSVFGVATLPAEIVLASWSIAVVMLSYLVTRHAFARLGTSHRALLAALLFGCIAPIYLAQEAVDFRLWDGGLTVLLMAVLLDRIVAVERRDSGGPRDAVVLGLISAALLLVNAPVGVAAAGCVAVLALRRLAWRHIVLLGVVSAMLLIVTVTPWVIRNERTFGAFIPSRSNAGLELSIGMDPLTLTASDRKARFMARLGEVHPVTPAGMAAMRAAGDEARYSKLLLRQTIAWMRDHPMEMMRLLLLHLRQQFAPEPWQFAVFENRGLPPAPRAALATIINLLGVAGIAWSVARRRPGWLYVALLIVGISVLTLPFQPMKRYNYLFYPILLFSAADLVATGLKARRKRIEPASFTPRD
jgi:hypothetical protein